jgi:hypothetical protein
MTMAEMGFQCTNCRSSITEEDVQTREDGTFSGGCPKCRLNYGGDYESWKKLRPGSYNFQAPASMMKRFTLTLDKEVSR